MFGSAPAAVFGPNDRTEPNRIRKTTKKHTETNSKKELPSYTHHATLDGDTYNTVPPFPVLFSYRYFKRRSYY